MNDLVTRIAEGSATLLGIDEICKRLGISRSTFDRWQRNGQAPHNHSMLTAAGQVTRALNKKLGIDDDAHMGFPPPDIRIGASPKWEIDTFKNWLRMNASKG